MAASVNLLIIDLAAARALGRVASDAPGWNDRSGRKTTSVPCSRPLIGYFFAIVNDDIKTRHFAVGRTRRVFADYVEGQYRLTDSRRDLQHNKAFDVTWWRDIQQTIDQRTIHIFGRIGLEQIILGGDPPNRLTLAIGKDYLLAKFYRLLGLRVVNIDRGRVNPDHDVGIAAGGIVG